jgi:hypothetical protein
MSSGVVVKKRRSGTRRCQHRWIIESPHGATSRGHCKLCGANKRFPNAAEDAQWEPGGALGRWSSRRGVAKPTSISLGNSRKS